MTTATYGRRRDDVSAERLADDLAAAEARVALAGQREARFLASYTQTHAGTDYTLLREAVLDGEAARKRASRCRRELRQLEQVSA